MGCHTQTGTLTYTAREKKQGSVVESRWMIRNKGTTSLSVQEKDKTTVTCNTFAKKFFSCTFFSHLLLIVTKKLPSPENQQKTVCDATVSLHSAHRRHNHYKPQKSKTYHSCMAWKSRKPYHHVNIKLLLVNLLHLNLIYCSIDILISLKLQN